jgi:glycosyltransferase involved in cell wall biosynthesis
MPQRPLRVLYVFTARKRGLLAGVARGDAPDTLLFGLNHVAEHGVQADFHEPEYGPAGRAIARQVGRLGPDALQLRTLPRFTRHDVVFLTGAWPLLLAARAIPAHRRPKLVWLNMTLTNLIRRGGWRARAVSMAVRQADRIVCVAEFQRRFLHERLDIPYARLPLCLSGTDVRFYDPTKAAPPQNGNATWLGGEGVVLAAGRDAGRDYVTLARAAQEAPWELRLVCSPRNVRGVTLPSTATMRCDISQVALRDEYAACDVVVVPTQGDGSTAGSDCSGTLVMLDALAMSQPVVITRRASVPDYLPSAPPADPPADPVPPLPAPLIGMGAIQVPAGETAALSEAIRWALSQRDDAELVAHEGREHVHENLTTRHFAARVAGVFHEVASARSGT